jgi:large subunit ribosomal protein L1
MTSRRYQAACAVVQEEAQKGPLALGEVVRLLQASHKEAALKFQPTLEIAVRLGIDAKQSNQSLRGVSKLPHGVGGAPKKVIVFATGEQATEAEKAGASVGDEALIDALQKGEAFDYDVVISTPSMMAKLRKLGKVLGPKGLMPNPKEGTVTDQVGAAVESALAGQVRIRNDKAGIVHAPVGKLDFKASQLVDNVMQLVADVVRLKPASSKGRYLNRVFLSYTMGPALEVDLQSVDS